ncbi:MAG: dipeptidase, partial [Acidimicrobiia bacterium]|nr:dipeptidase [Acidimicrobiia bacterium]
YVGVIDENSGDVRHPDHFFSLAQARGWHRPGQPFDVNTVYGDGKGRWAGVQWIESEMARRATAGNGDGSGRESRDGGAGGSVREGRDDGGITLADVMWAVRTSKLTGDTAGYGQVVPLVDPGHAELRLLWHTQVGALAAPFVPVFMGNTSVPPRYRQHRYLTAGEAKRFLDNRHQDWGDPDTVSAIPQAVEATRSATAEFKRLMHLVLRHVDEYLNEVTEVWEARERRLVVEVESVLAAARVLLDAGRADLAVNQLTYFTNTELDKALDLAGKLADALEVRSHALHGDDDDPRPRSAEQIW